MKRAVATALLVSLLLTGCAGQTMPTNEELGWEEDWVRVGALLGVEPMEDFTLSENKDALGADGLYYASWTAGEAQAYTNAEGKDAQLYDAQIYVLLQQFQDESAARSGLESWQEREEQNYACGEALTEIYVEQEFTLLPLLQGKEDNPYSHGAAAFAVRGSWGICVELLCQDSFEGDAQSCLEDFLAGFHFADQGGGE